jgi:UDP-N-acetylmuramate dehydrogenase
MIASVAQFGLQISGIEPRNRNSKPFPATKLLTCPRIIMYSTGPKIIRNSDGFKRFMSPHFDANGKGGRESGLVPVGTRLGSDLTTLGVGGPCRLYCEVTSEEELEAAVDLALSDRLPFLYLGEGSNVLFDDAGFAGLVIRNKIAGIRAHGREVRVGGGHNLIELIDWLNQNKLAGLEALYGIPGTVGGAIVGNAGAFGQEISDCVVEVRVWSPGGVHQLSRADLGFFYRHSRFKEQSDWFLIDCTLRLRTSGRDLQAVSEEIFQRRLQKYPAQLRCPGSFFKNIPEDRLSEESRARIPDSFFHFGKVAAGQLLEAVGANGSRRGGAFFADYHGNLLASDGTASSSDILALADEFSDRVWKRFGVRLEPEIRIIVAT